MSADTRRAYFKTKRRGRPRKTIIVDSDPVDIEDTPQVEYSFLNSQSGNRSSRPKPIMIAEAGEAFEWDRWTRELPFLKFPEDCEVQVIPPYLTGIIRFVVKKGNNTVSVYFDAHAMAGMSRSPYWEIYPDNKDNNTRFLLGEENTMMKAIVKSLNRDNQKKRRGSKKIVKPTNLHNRMMQLEI